MWLEIPSALLKPHASAAYSCLPNELTRSSRIYAA